jgi:hypothetical protein
VTAVLEEPGAITKKILREGMLFCGFYLGKACLEGE